MPYQLMWFVVWLLAAGINTVWIITGQKGDIPLWVVVVSDVAITLCCFFGAACELLSYKEGRKHGCASLVKFSELKEGEVYRVDSLYHQPNSPKVLVFLSEVVDFDKSKPYLSGTEALGFLDLVMGDPESSTTDIDENVVVNNWVVLRSTRSSNGLRLLKWLDKNKMSSVG